MKWVFGDESTLFKKFENLFFQPVSDDTCAIQNISAFLVPGIAFDREGNRLGRGYGFYDRVLSKAKHSKKIGVAWSVQIHSQILPIQSFDIPMDILVTEKWTLYTHQGAH